MAKKAGLPNPRPMTRAEIRELRKAGLDPALHETEKSAAERLQENSKLIDWILDNVYGDYDTENAPYPDCVDLAFKTYSLTYGNEDQVKNSSTSGPGSPETEQNTVDTA